MSKVNILIIFVVIAAIMFCLFAVVICLLKKINVYRNNIQKINKKNKQTDRIFEEYKVKVKELTEENSVLLELEKELTNEIRGLEIKNTAITQKYNERKTEAFKLSVAIDDLKKVKNTNILLLDKISKLNNEVSQNRQKYLRAEALLEGFTKDLSDKRKKEDELIKEVNEKASHISFLEKLTDKATKDSEKNIEVVKALKEKIKTTQKEQTLYSKENIKITKQLKATLAIIENSKSEISELKKTISKLKVESNKNKNLYTIVEKNKSLYESRINVQTKEILSLKCELSKVKTELSKQLTPKKDENVFEKLAKW